MVLELTIDIITVRPRVSRDHNPAAPFRIIAGRVPRAAKRTGISVQPSFLLRLSKELNELDVLLVLHEHPAFFPLFHTQLLRVEVKKPGNSLNRFKWPGYTGCCVLTHRNHNILRNPRRLPPDASSKNCRGSARSTLSCGNIDVLNIVTIRRVRKMGVSTNVEGSRPLIEWSPAQSSRAGARAIYRTPRSCARAHKLTRATREIALRPIYRPLLSRSAHRPRGNAGARIEWSNANPQARFQPSRARTEQETTR